MRCVFASGCVGETQEAEHLLHLALLASRTAAVITREWDDAAVAQAKKVLAASLGKRWSDLKVHTVVRDHGSEDESVQVWLTSAHFAKLDQTDRQELVWKVLQKLPDAVFFKITLVMAHTHPSVMLVDECGRPVTEPCWLRACFLKKPTMEHYPPPYPKLVVMPAFGDLGSGYPVNEGKGRLLGPLFRNGLVDLPKARAYLVDGTFLGSVRDLQVEGARGGRRRV